MLFDGSGNSFSSKLKTSLQLMQSIEQNKTDKDGDRETEYLLELMRNKYQMNKLVLTTNQIKHNCKCVKH